MSEITFTPEQKTLLVERIQAYFAAELDQEIGSFPAEFLLDARVVFESRLESVGEAIHELERPTPFAR